MSCVTNFAKNLNNIGMYRAVVPLSYNNGECKCPDSIEINSNTYKFKQVIYTTPFGCLSDKTNNSRIGCYIYKSEGYEQEI